MNPPHAKEFLAAAAACDPGGNYAGPRALVDSVASIMPGAEWQVAVRGGDASALRLGLLVCGDSAAGRAALARVLGVAAEDIVGEPASGRPWIDAAWDLSGGRWTSVERARAAKGVETLRQLLPKPGPERRLASRRFAAALFPEPIASGLEVFDALEKIGAVQSAAGRDGWTLTLARPVPWPRFLRCDVAAAFVPRAAQLSLLLRDARVAALDFDGDALWARLVG